MGPGDIRPTDLGYIVMGDIWANALYNIPSDWIQAPIGPDPDHNVKSSLAERGYWPEWWPSSGRSTP